MNSFANCTRRPRHRAPTCRRGGVRTPTALPAAGPRPRGPHLEADMCAWQNYRTPTSGFDIGLPNGPNGLREPLRRRGEGGAWIIQEALL